MVVQMLSIGVRETSAFEPANELGKRFEYRSLIFFAILLALALATFSLISVYTGNS